MEIRLQEVRTPIFLLDNFFVSDFQSLFKKEYKNILQGATELMEIHGEFFKGLFGDYLTPLSLCFLRISLLGITEKIFFFD